MSFADVNVSEAKLLLIRAQNSLDDAYAELARALGANRIDQLWFRKSRCRRSAPKPRDLVAQAVANRPELASLQFSRDAAYKFADAEKDLSRPTVSLVGVAAIFPIFSS